MSQNFVKFQKNQLENLVDFEKCCKMRIFLQKSVPIQPKTSNILPKFAEIATLTAQLLAELGNVAEIITEEAKVIRPLSAQTRSASFQQRG